ncbi:hypothetical protein ACIBO2_56920 [Nonomuraea sp. NPDC050022]|uniref:hypothetical protein n=1 Tax=Nonomuraea sp. NPDC050022 TaxID=3364358 RepID=UPI003793237B
MSDALDRTSYVLGLGAGVVDLSAVATVKLAELASYGLHAKAAKIKQLQGERGWRRRWPPCGSWRPRRTCASASAKSRNPSRSRISHACS